jgi:hypothetical protein
MDEKKAPERHSAFFDLERDPQRAELTRPKSLLRTTEWGGLTLLSLLVGWAFPPYFVSVLALAFLNAGGLLWITHLSEAGRERLRQFERDFAKGHGLEEHGQFAAAVAVYEALVPQYQDYPKIAQIAVLRIEQLRTERPDAFRPSPAKLIPIAKPASKPKAKAKPKARKKARP